MHNNSSGAVINTTTVIAILQCYKGIMLDSYIHVAQRKVIQRTQVMKIFWSEFASCIAQHTQTSPKIFLSKSMQEHVSDIFTNRKVINIIYVETYQHM